MRFQRIASWAVLTFVVLTPVAAEETDPGFTPSESFQTWVTDLVREQLPEHYEKSKNWGHTKKVFAGWKFEQDGLRIETRRRWKDVNDGTWTQLDVNDG